MDVRDRYSTSPIPPSPLPEYNKMPCSTFNECPSSALFSTQFICAHHFDQHTQIKYSRNCSLGVVIIIRYFLLKLRRWIRLKFKTYLTMQSKSRDIRIEKTTRCSEKVKN